MIDVILDPPNSANVFMRCDVCGVRESVVDGSAEKAFRERHAHCSAIERKGAAVIDDVREAFRLAREEGLPREVAVNEGPRTYWKEVSDGEKTSE